VKTAAAMTALRVLRLDRRVRRYVDQQYDLCMKEQRESGVRTRRCFKSEADQGGQGRSIATLPPAV